MKYFTCIIFCALFASCIQPDKKQQGNTTFNKIPSVIQLSSLNECGLFSLQGQKLVPDSNGVLKKIKIELPEYINGLYMRPYSPFHGNRVGPIWFKNVFNLANYQPQLPESGDNLNQGTFLLLEKASGKFLALLPVVSTYAGNTFSVINSTIYLTLATYGTESINKKLPLLAYAESENPYEAINLAWKQAMNTTNVKGNIKWRSEKNYPEPYKYLGWCSWEHFRTNINEEIILDAINDIKLSDLPIRWVLVDDGYLDADHKTLRSFGVDKDKFPNGWKPITSQKDDKIKWMGIWRNFNGYMGGISENHTMKELKDDIVKVEQADKTRWMSRTTQESANRFYNAMTSDTKENGFDIIKVDFQSENIKYNSGTANPVLGVHYNNSALEKNCIEKELNLLNCIGQQNFNVFNQTHSSILRGSVDYKVTFDKVDYTLVQNFMNTSWIGPIHWIDHDMFHTSFEETARLMAVARAVSGGPIYLSDETKNIVNTHLKPLMYNDGQLIRPLAPGVPMPQSLMNNPFFGGKAFRVVAPLKNNSAAIMAVNLNRDTTVQSSITLNDYPKAAGMLQPANSLWNIPEEGILLFDTYSKTAQELKTNYIFDLPTRKERLFQLNPITNGWSVIGRADKYLPAATYELMKSSKEMVKIKLHENGNIFIWAKNKVPTSNNFKFNDLGNGLWLGNLIKNTESKEYTISMN